MTPSRFTVDPHILDNSDLSKIDALRHWQHQISVLLEQLQMGIILLPDPPSSGVYLDGSGNWSTVGGISYYTETWKWTTSTSSASGSGQVGINTGAWATATQLNINQFAASGRDMTPAFDLFVTGNEVLVQLQSDTTRYAKYTLTANAVSMGGWYQCAVSCTASGGAMPNPNAPMTVTVLVKGGGTVSAPTSSLTDLGSPAGNSTINTAQAFLIAVNLVWTTAANWTLTLQNVALGSQFFLRLLNNSGAARTFTVTATNPSAAPYTIRLWVPGGGALTGANSINNGAALNLQGVSYTIGGAPTIQLFGFGSTG